MVELQGGAVDSLQPTDVRLQNWDGAGSGCTSRSGVRETNRNDGADGCSSVGCSTVNL